MHNSLTTVMTRSIRLVSSEQKFRKVKRTFLTPSQQPLNRFSSCKFGQLIVVIVFLENRVGNFCSPLPFLNNRHSFKGIAGDLSPLTLSYSHKRTNARVKNQRNGFTVERVRESKCEGYRSLPLILSGTGLEFTQTYAFAKNVSITLSLAMFKGMSHNLEL